MPHIKSWFFLKNRPIYFHINSASDVRPVKRNKLSFSSIEINKPFPASVHSVSLVRFKFRCQLQLLPQIKCLLTLNVETSVISVVRKLQITSSGRSLMNSRKNVGPKMDLEKYQHWLNVLAKTSHLELHEAVSRIRGYTFIKPRKAYQGLHLEAVLASNLTNFNSRVYHCVCSYLSKNAIVDKTINFFHLFRPRDLYKAKWVISFVPFIELRWFIWLKC